jgi:hypothetical protein
LRDLASRLWPMAVREEKKKNERIINLRHDMQQL